MKVMLLMRIFFGRHPTLPEIVFSEDFFLLKGSFSFLFTVTKYLLVEDCLVVGVFSLLL